MMKAANNQKIIFGLKVRQHRIDARLSFSELAEATGMSLSYLNEIEKGKKYPKDDKIILLAKALQTTAEELSTSDLPKSLAPVQDLLQSNFLNELPLHLFGIDLAKVVEIIANAPLRVGAFVSTLLELSRNYALREENFYFGALRSYLELHNNYFDDLEEAVKSFVLQHKIAAPPPLPERYLRRLLEKKYQYQIIENGLKDYPSLAGIRSVYNPKTEQLLVNGNLNDQQKAFLYGKELGFRFLQLKERANTSSLLKVQSFEEALNHFKAGYFSAALLINRENFIRDVGIFLKKDRWDGAYLLSLLDKYAVSPETLFQRLTNVLPYSFGLEKIFFLRIVYHPQNKTFDLNRELHLNRRHHPHSNSLDEHYCRRWVSITLIQDIEKARLNLVDPFESTTLPDKEKIFSSAQRSIYYGSKDEYFCLTLAKPVENGIISVTIGILIERETRKKINFIDDPAVGKRVVNTTCERCPIPDCAERAVPPVLVEKRMQRRRIQEDLKKILGA